MMAAKVIVGKKPGAGRKSLLDEMKSRDLCHRSFDHLIARMKDPNTPVDVKDKIALVIAPRYIVEKKEISGNEGGPLVVRWEQ